MYLNELPLEFDYDFLGVNAGMYEAKSLFCPQPAPIKIRVHQTVGNRTGLTGYRSNRSGPVRSGMKPVQIQNLNLNSKK